MMEMLKTPYQKELDRICDKESIRILTAQVEQLKAELQVLKEHNALLIERINEMPKDLMEEETLPFFLKKQAE